VPDVLADVFESIAGAVLLTLEGSLTAVQKSCQPFFGYANGNKKVILNLPLQK
jgi:dsRNA-specific ribonuclease